MPTETYTITRRPGWSFLPDIEVEITCDVDARPSVKLGLAVRAAFACDDVLSGADLSGADLRRADLRRADLRRTDLSGADLRGAVMRDDVMRGADLRGAVMRRTDLSGADLRDADLSGADLRDADLSGADLRGADLGGADLRRTDLSGAVMRGAVMRGAVMRDAVMRGAVMRGADLSGADLSGADLRGADLRHYQADLIYTLVSLGAFNALEINDLIWRLRRGHVDGSTYGRGDNPCACLVGSLASERGVSADTLDRDSERPAEQWFLMIKPGDRAGDDTGGGWAASQVVEWLLAAGEAMGLGLNPDGVPTARSQALFGGAGQ